MYAQLGSIVFEGLKTFQRLVETYAVILPQHANINTKSSLQMSGAALDTKGIDILLHNAFCDVDAELAALKSAINSGAIMPLILGTGEVVGSFVIQDMSVEVLQASALGKRLICGVSLNLLEYFDSDPDATAQNAAADAGAAVQDGNIKPLDIAPLRPVGGAGEPAFTLIDAKVQTDAIPAYIDNSVTFADQAAYWYGRIGDALEAAFDYYNDFLGMIAQISTQIDNYTTLVAAVGDTQAALTAFMSIMPPATFSDLSTANTNLQEAALDMRVASGPLNSLAGAREL